MKYIERKTASGGASGTQKMKKVATPRQMKKVATPRRSSVGATVTKKDRITGATTTQNRTLKQSSAKEFNSSGNLMKTKRKISK